MGVQVYEVRCAYQRRGWRAGKGGSAPFLRDLLPNMARVARVAALLPLDAFELLKRLGAAVDKQPQLLIGPAVIQHLRHIRKEVPAILGRGCCRGPGPAPSEARE